jgi:hypothetical protein
MGGRSSLTLAAVKPDNRSVIASPDSVEARFRTLERHIAALESRLSALEPLTDAQFLKAIATSVQGHVFNTSELRRHTRVDADLRRALGTLTNVQLGIKLGKLAGRNIGGLILQRVVREEDGVVWAVAVADLHPEAGLSTDDGA